MVDGIGLDQPGLALGTQSVAVTADGDDMTVVQQPIEDSGGHHCVTEHLAPLADRPVAGLQQAAAFVAAGDQLEEQVGRTRLRRQVAQLVDGLEGISVSLCLSDSVCFLLVAGSQHPADDSMRQRTAPLSAINVRALRAFIDDVQA